MSNAWFSGAKMIAMVSAARPKSPIAGKSRRNCASAKNRGWGVGSKVRKPLRKRDSLWSKTPETMRKTNETGVKMSQTHRTSSNFIAKRPQSDHRTARLIRLALFTARAYGSALKPARSLPHDRPKHIPVRCRVGPRGRRVLVQPRLLPAPDSRRADLGDARQAAADTATSRTSTRGRARSRFAPARRSRRRSGRRSFSSPRSSTRTASRGARGASSGSSKAPATSSKPMSPASTPAAATRSITNTRSATRATPPGPSPAGTTTRATTSSSRRARPSACSAPRCRAKP